MADDQNSYDGEEGEVPGPDDYDSQSTTAAAAAGDNAGHAADDGAGHAAGDGADHAAGDASTDVTTAVAGDDYADDEPIEDYVVDLVVNEQPADVTVSPDLVNAAITDIHGNVIGTKTNVYDRINGVTTAVYDELNSNSTAITGSKGLWGWSTLKLILVGLLALCILALILGILFFVFGKKFKKNKRTTTTGPTKAVVNKGISPDPKYQPVPNV